MTYDYDDDDDILDDIDDDILDDISDTPADEAASTPRPRRPYQPPVVSEDTPDMLAQRMLSAGRSPLIEGTKDHEPELIQAAHAAGERYPEQADVVMLVAQGIRIDDLDAWHHQSAKGISATLDAARDAGADLNKEVDGRPAAHRLAEYYGERIVGNFYDTRYEAMVGLTDQGQAERLAVFAEKGVDFSVKDADGRSPFSVVNEIAKREATARGAEEGLVLDHVRREMAPVRQAARGQSVAARAAQRVAEKGPSASAEIRRPARSGPSLDD